MKNKWVRKVCAGVFLSLVVTVTASAEKIIDNVRHVDASEASNLLSKSDHIQVLDVRTAKEFNQGHINGAINIDYYADDFSAQIAKLDKDTTYLVHCRSGGRSGKSLELLKSAGVKKLIHLDGGLRAWQGQDLPLAE